MHLYDDIGDALSSLPGLLSNYLDSCSCFSHNLYFFFRFIKWETIDRSLWLQLQFTILDRLRIPWPGGALKIAPSVLFAFVLVPSLIYFGSISFAVSLITYFLILPTLLYVSIRSIKERNKALNSSFHLQTKASRSPFYSAFFISSLLWLYFFFVFYIIDFMKINALESSILCALCGSSLSLLYICKRLSSMEFEPPSEHEVATYLIV